MQVLTKLSLIFPSFLSAGEIPESIPQYFILTVVKHLSITLKVYIRLGYLPGFGPTEWNGKKPICPKQYFTLKWREKSSVLLRFREQFQDQSAVNICSVLIFQEPECDYALKLIYILKYCQWWDIQQWLFLFMKYLDICCKLGINKTEESKISMMWVISIMAL